MSEVDKPDILKQKTPMKVLPSEEDKLLPDEKIKFKLHPSRLLLTTQRKRFPSFLEVIVSILCILITYEYIYPTISFSPKFTTTCEVSDQDQTCICIFKRKEVLNLNWEVLDIASDVQIKQTKSGLTQLSFPGTTYSFQSLLECNLGSSILDTCLKTCPSVLLGQEAWYGGIFDDFTNLKYHDNILLIGLGLGNFIHQVHQRFGFKNMDIVDTHPTICELQKYFVPIDNVNVFNNDIQDFFQQDGNIGYDIIVTDISDISFWNSTIGHFKNHLNHNGVLYINVVTAETKPFSKLLQENGFNFSEHHNKGWSNIWIKAYM